MEFTWRELKRHEIAGAINLFSNAMARDWPVQAEEAKHWVQSEFFHPKSIVFGAFVQNQLVGVCSLVPLDFVLSQLDNLERDSVEKSLKEKNAFSNAIYWGGLGVSKSFEGKGVARKLIALVERFSSDHGCQSIVCQTARPSQKYSGLKGLPMVLKRQFKELELGKKIFHKNPPDLEKVWLYKKI